MVEWVAIILFAVSVVFFLSILYHIVPAKRISAKKPEFVLFPKYIIPISDELAFAKKLEGLNFRKTSSNRYTRGYFFGDFFASSIHLSVKINKQSQSAILGSPLMVIAFDTGDLWEIANEFTNPATK
jgi:hypothetical protein